MLMLVLMRESTRDVLLKVADKVSAFLVVV